MIRRFNYTGRKRIGQEHCQILLKINNGTASFDATINLADYALPSDASVYIEAYRQTSWMRFDFGTVGAQVIPDDRQLSLFESFEDVLFRVRVVSRAIPYGKLLAEADRIRLRQSDEQEDFRKPLLPVISKSLNGIVSRVDFEDRPRLEINSAIGNWRELAGTPAFRAMVLSYAVKEILTRILHIEKFCETDTDDLDDWKTQWLKYAAALPGVGNPPEDCSNEGRVDDWIDTAVSAFGRTFGVLDWFNTFWQED